VKLLKLNIIFLVLNGCGFIAKASLIPEGMERLERIRQAQERWEAQMEEKSDAWVAFMKELELMLEDYRKNVESLDGCMKALQKMGDES